METVNGEFIMQGCSPRSKERLKTIDDLYALIKQIGFIPLFANRITGFSVEERVTASQWWTGDEKTDPWVWRQIACVHPDIAYGKFFDKKAGFISKRSVHLMKGNSCWSGFGLWII